VSLDRDELDAAILDQQIRDIPTPKTKPKSDQRQIQFDSTDEKTAA
jgi:hypothetical protein